MREGRERQRERDAVEARRGRSQQLPTTTFHQNSKKNICLFSSPPLTLKMAASSSEATIDLTIALEGDGHWF